MKKTALCLALVSLLALGGQAVADICTVDDVPAATLLVPYFEVELDEAGGLTTLFEINNASATAVLAHVVVWSDLSVPVLDFNVYLTGYDIVPINMRDVLNGILPTTASDGQDPADTISPQGDFSQDINFASCAGQLPIPPLPASFVNHLQNSLTGQPSSLLGGLCAGRDLGDNIARGYITVDTVNNCTLRFPGDAGYFGAGGTGDATNQNVLWGNYYYVDPAENFAQAETAVHIEADAINPETSVPGNYTFYGRYVDWTAIDNREPLATNFAARYLDNVAFTGGTDMIVWRDSKVDQAPFSCASQPAWFPLGQQAIVIFDEEEQPDVPETFPVSPQPEEGGLIPFPAEAQRVTVNGPDGALPSPFEAGWMFLNLNQTNVAQGAVPPEVADAAQAWVTTVMSAEGRFSVGFNAIVLDSACNPNVIANPATVGIGGF